MIKPLSPMLIVHIKVQTKQQFGEQKDVGTGSMKVRPQNYELSGRSEENAPAPQKQFREPLTNWAALTSPAKTLKLAGSTRKLLLNQLKFEELNMLTLYT